MTSLKLLAMIGLVSVSAAVPTSAFAHDSHSWRRHEGWHADHDGRGWRGHPPEARRVWVPGYWRGHGPRHVWIEGNWAIAPHPQAVWVAPSWAWSRDARQWVWVEGHWGP